MPEELGRRHRVVLVTGYITTSYKINAISQPLLRLQRLQQTVHHPHKLCLQEPEQELKLQPQLCRSGWRHAIPRPRPATNGHPAAIPRPSHDTK
jgi:hypothetical protein